MLSALVQYEIISKRLQCNKRIRKTIRSHQCTLLIFLQLNTKCGLAGLGLFWALLGSSRLFRAFFAIVYNNISQGSPGFFMDFLGSFLYILCNYILELSRDPQGTFLKNLFQKYPKLFNLSWVAH